MKVTARRDLKFCLALPKYSLLWMLQGTQYLRNACRQYIVPWNRINAFGSGGG